MSEFFHDTHAPPDRGPLPAASSAPVPPRPATVDPAVPGTGQMLLIMLIWTGITFLCAVAGALAYTLVNLAMGEELQDIGTGGTPYLTWLTVAANSIATAACLLLGRLWSRRAWPEILPLRRFEPVLVPAIAVAGSGLAILLSEVDNITRLILPMPRFLAEVLSDMFHFDVPTFILLVIVAPLTEEFLFRGLILNGLRKRHSPFAAIAISSLGFALLHLNPYQFIGGFVIGAVLGWLRLGTGSLWPCILLHALHNSLVFFSLKLPFDIRGFNVVSEGALQPGWFDLCGVGLAAVGFFLLCRLLSGRVRPAAVPLSGGGEAR